MNIKINDLIIENFMNMDNEHIIFTNNIITNKTNTAQALNLIKNIITRNNDIDYVADLFKDPFQPMSFTSSFTINKDGREDDVFYYVEIGLLNNSELIQNGLDINLYTPYIIEESLTVNDTMLIGINVSDYTIEYFGYNEEDELEFMPTGNPTIESEAFDVDNDRMLSLYIANGGLSYSTLFNDDFMSYIYDEIGDDSYYIMMIFNFVNESVLAFTNKINRDLESIFARRRSINGEVDDLVELLIYSSFNLPSHMVQPINEFLDDVNYITSEMGINQNINVSVNMENIIEGELISNCSLVVYDNDLIYLLAQASNSLVFELKMITAVIVSLEHPNFLYLDDYSLLNHNIRKVLDKQNFNPTGQFILT